MSRIRPALSAGGISFPAWRLLCRERKPSKRPLPRVTCGLLTALTLRAMARRAPRVSPAPPDRSPSLTPAVPEAVAPAAEAPDVDQERLRSLPPDWLPLALIVGDAVICAVSVLLAYWLRYGRGGQVLPSGPYLAAVPVVIVFYLFALAVQRQYSSWRGTSLAEQLLSLYAGIGLAGILILAAVALG